MKKTIITFLLGLYFFNINAQTYQQLIKKADSCYNTKNYVMSKSFYKKAFKVNPKAKSGFYNAACAASLAGDKKLTFDWLNIAIARGFDNIRHMKIDPDLDNLHTDKRWKNLTEQLQKKVDAIEANYDKPLQGQLIAIFNDDQTIRREFIEAQKKYGHEGKVVDSLGKNMMYQDSINLIKITKILDERGWVGKEKVGQQANQTLFLVIQHSDLKVQQKYLPMMREAVKHNNADAGSLALLEDRVLLGEGKKQIYGSQIGFNPTTKKEYVLPLDDPDNVDKRREQVGLEPLADYVKYWNIKWDVEGYKKELPELEKLNEVKK